MKEKEQKAKEYADNLPLCKYEEATEAFKAGWNAALDHFSSLPFDKMMKAFDEHFKNMEGKHENINCTSGCHEANTSGQPSANNDSL